MKIPLVDLNAQFDLIKDEVNEAIQGVLQSGQFILGPEVKAFEQEIAPYCGTKFAVSTASGTDALQLALLACGIKPGDEVITTPFTFIATAEAITQCGAIPVLIDIDPKTYNIDPAKIESRITQRTKAILPVHLYGQPADMDPILELGKKYNLKVIEDCAQSLGALYCSHRSTNSRFPCHCEERSDVAISINSMNSTNSTNWQRVGSLGDAGCLSFFPSKVLGAYGDGGMVVTDNPEIAEKVVMLRNHGCKEKYYHLIPGFNSRLDELQAAILRVKLRHLDDWIELRRQKASVYSQLFDQIDGIQPPYVAPDSYHIFNYYTIRLESPEVNRDKMREYLSSQGIGAAIYYPLSLHLQEVYKSLAHKIGDFPESEQAQEQVLSLPMYPELEDDKIEVIAKAIEAFDK